MNRLSYQFPFWLSLVSLIAIFFDFGFDQSSSLEQTLKILYLLNLSAGILFTLVRLKSNQRKYSIKVVVFDVLSILFFLMVILGRLEILKNLLLFNAFSGQGWLYGAICLAFIREVSVFNLKLSNTILNPAQLFILSFLGIILTGTFLLLLPNASYSNLSFIDALFTATSAVCVTGLIVVDTGSYFTLFGQIIILGLIQVGGLGIMTFASYFSYFFRGDTSYKNQLMLSDMTTSNKIGEVFTTLKKIIITTLGIELLGAILLFGNTTGPNSNDFFNQSFFAVFHAVSAFCNAGFSTLPNSLAGNHFANNYSFQLIIIGLFVTGGLGFPIVFNLVRYLKYLLFQRLIPKLTGAQREYSVVPWVVTLNSRIVIITSATLIVVGTAVFYAFEYNNALAGQSEIGKIISALFAATTPRTAGFHSIDLNSLRFSTIMLIFLLMWVGASPGSTGGGIKTNTFAIATLNFWSIARGKERLEIFRREIADSSIRRAFAIISLSLVVIGAGVFAISFFDHQLDLLSIAFECFSAYSTVGLSLGITTSLSSGSKFVIILIMFIGRVSMLSILIAMIRKVKHKNYRYSKEEILIN